MDIFFSALLGLTVGMLPQWKVLRQPGKSGILLCLLYDVLRGMAVVAAIRFLFANPCEAALVGGVLATFGSVVKTWTGQERSRGLGVAGGALMFINPLPVVLWCLMWLTGYAAIRKNVDVGIMAGTIGGILLWAAAPDPLVRLTMVVDCATTAQLTSALLIIAFIVFFRHLRYIQALFRQQDVDD